MDFSDMRQLRFGLKYLFTCKIGLKTKYNPKM